MDKTTTKRTPPLPSQGAAALRAWLARAEMSQAAFGRIMDVPRCTVGDWLTGRHLPKLGVAVHIADATGIQVRLWSVAEIDGGSADNS